MWTSGRWYSFTVLHHIHFGVCLSSFPFKPFTLFISWYWTNPETSSQNNPSRLTVQGSHETYRARIFIWKKRKALQQIVHNYRKKNKDHKLHKLLPVLNCKTYDLRKIRKYQIPFKTKRFKNSFIITEAAKFWIFLYLLFFAHADFRNCIFFLITKLYIYKYKRWNKHQ